MFTFQPKPAIVQMLNPTRGDQYVVVTDDAHYVVTVTDILSGGDTTIGVFRPGTVGINQHGEPVVLSLRPNTTFTACWNLNCWVTCDECAGIMKVAGDNFICVECGVAT